MLIVLKTKTRFDVIALFVSALVLGTFILDRLVMMIARPYLLSYFNDIVNKKYAVENAIGKIMWLTLAVQTCYIVIFHLLVIPAFFMAIFNQRFKYYRKELLFAYLVIVFADICINLMKHILA
jgi:hypothetical protein